MKEAQVNERKPRADSVRNQERLLSAAKGAFRELGPGASLEEIARRAEVGIGTLYRHFPTRDALVEAVYRREVEQLGGAADRMLAEHPPAEALRQWLLVFIDYLATKKVMAGALNALVAGPSALYASSGNVIRAAIGKLLERGKAAGEVRSEIETPDIMQALAGLAYNADSPGWRTSAERLVDIVVAGIKPEATGGRRPGARP